MPLLRNQVHSGAVLHIRIVAVILYNLYCFIKENNFSACASETSPTVIFFEVHNYCGYFSVQENILVLYFTL